MDIGACQAIVTGAASGLGREFCAGLAGTGARVVAMDRDRRGLRRLADELGIAAYQVDVAKEDEVAAAVRRAFDERGPADVLINSAGGYRDGLLLKDGGDAPAAMPPARWRTGVGTDLTGTFLMTREVTRRMVEHGVESGVVVTISSISRAGNAGQAGHAAARAGVVAFTRSAALELAPHGIRAAAIALGLADPPALAAMDPGRLAAWIAEVPLRRLGLPGEILAGVRFIIECDHFNGRCLEIDGGLAT
ncbi:SDR family oxidoreductase [Nonomuraea sp. NN258]|uniref:SDR family NAD(P)-dependent oxidoreductase n=1 Tax=Nonomuraea antri TaxID=2730852 RepID=UPI001569AA29|nr:SDR family NAD(P)-dependent oxidoreductase [Nonomuraea antri]NRQ38563.1 SDR family oxidoreductase [Nonomuraea antri]